MAGHNKWSKVKRLKAVTDGRKGKVFSRLSRDITMAAKAGGGDPGGNARLRTLLLKAREANMPADNVDRAIKKGTGELPGVIFEELHYEGYGPSGVAFVVMATTDNKQRTAQEVRPIFSNHGGNLAQVAAVVGKNGADLLRGALLVVGGGHHHEGHATGAVALVMEFLEDHAR